MEAIIVGVIIYCGVSVVTYTLWDGDLCGVNFGILCALLAVPIKRSIFIRERLFLPPFVLEFPSHATHRLSLILYSPSSDADLVLQFVPRESKKAEISVCFAFSYN